MSVHFLSLLIVCQAARMEKQMDEDIQYTDDDIQYMDDEDIHIFQEARMDPDMNSMFNAFIGDFEVVLPDIADRADVDFSKPEAWQGLEHLALSDFSDLENPKTLKKMQQHKLFAPKVNELLSLLSQSASASKVKDTTVEAKLSLFLNFHDTKLKFFKSVTQDSGREVGGEEKYYFMVFIMCQAVNRYPDLLSALRIFGKQMSEINLRLDRVKWGLVEFTYFEGNSMGLQDVDGWIDTLNDALIEDFMPKQTTAILTAFRNRVVQEVQKIGIPNDLIRAAALQKNWQVELKKLKAYEIRQAFVPVWQPNGKMDKQQALRQFTWFLINPKPQTTQNVFAVMRDIIVKKSDLKLLIDPKVKQNKAMLFDMFLHQALNLVAVDNGRFLAGLIHSIWMEKRKGLNEKRNLYKRYNIVNVSWRQFIQEKLLNKSNNDDIKEIVKSLLERVTEVNRDAPKQQQGFKSEKLADDLLKFFN